VVYLSGNSLRRLDGVAQLTDLSVLSASNNLLAHVDDLAALRACPHLEVPRGQPRLLARGAAQWAVAVSLLKTPSPLR
jgi:Leucine-rich repeat (LRR) protein